MGKAIEHGTIRSVPFPSVDHHEWATTSGFPGTYRVKGGAMLSLYTVRFYARATRSFVGGRSDTVLFYFATGYLRGAIGEGSAPRVSYRQFCGSYDGLIAFIVRLFCGDVGVIVEGGSHIFYHTFYSAHTIEATRDHHAQSNFRGRTITVPVVTTNGFRCFVSPYVATNDAGDTRHHFHSKEGGSCFFGK